MEKIAQGAEAIIYKEENKAIKERVSKSYRHPELDAHLIKSRTKKEAKIIRETKVNHPNLISQENSTIEMDYIDGKPVKEVLNKEIAKKIAQQLTILHDENIIHGDLTTSNMIYKESKVFIIDFGLSFTSIKLEDKAVDLHVFFESLESLHHNIYEEVKSEFLKAYSPKNKQEILNKLKAVEKRGKYKKKNE